MTKTLSQAIFDEIERHTLSREPITLSAIERCLQPTPEMIGAGHDVLHVFDGKTPLTALAHDVYAAMIGATDTFGSATPDVGLTTDKTGQRFIDVTCDGTPERIPIVEKTCQFTADEVKDMMKPGAVQSVFGDRGKRKIITFTPNAGNHSDLSDYYQQIADNFIPSKTITDRASSAATSMAKLIDGRIVAALKDGHRLQDMRLAQHPDRTELWCGDALLATHTTSWKIEE